MLSGGNVPLKGLDSLTLRFNSVPQAALSIPLTTSSAAAGAEWTVKSRTAICPCGRLQHLVRHRRCIWFHKPAHPARHPGPMPPHHCRPPPPAASAPAAWTWSGHLDFLNTDELRLQLRFAVLEQHADDLGQVPLQLVERFPLRVGTGEARNVANKQARVRTAQRSITAVKACMDTSRTPSALI